MEKLENKVLSLNKAYEDPESILWYWCNASGEIHVPGKGLYYSGKPEEMPQEARDIYEKIWSDGMPWACYVVQYNTTFGIGLFLSLDDDYVQNILIDRNPELKDLNMDREILRSIRTQAGRQMAAQIAEVLPNVTVFYGDDIHDGEDGDEVLVFISREALTTQENLFNLATRLNNKYGISVFEDAFTTLALSGYKSARDLLEGKLRQMIDDNRANVHEGRHSGYEGGYADGYHDAVVEVLNLLRIEHDEEFFN